MTPSVRQRLGLAHACDDGARARKPLVMARASAALFAAEGLLVLVATLVRHGPHAAALPALALVAGAMGLATGILLLFERMSPWTTHLVALSGAAAIALLIYAERPLYGLLFVWLLFFLTFFLKRRQAALHLAAMVAMCAAALFATEPAASAGEALIVIGGILVGTHFLVLILRGELARLVREQTAALEREREDRALLDVLFSSAPFGIAQLDRDLRYVRVNKTLAAANGFAPADQVGRTLREVLPDLADRLEPLMHEVMETGEPVVGVETESIAQDGATVHYRSARYPLRSPDGEIVGVGVIVDDVTELREAQARLERALAEQAKTARVVDALFADAPIGITLFDRELRYLRVNATYASWTGHAAGEHVGRRVSDLDPVVGAQVEPLMREVLRTGIAVVGSEATRADGCVFRSSRYPVRDEEGEVVGIATIVDDVTELKDAERRLHEALAAERKSGYFLDQLLDHAPLSLTFVDRDLRYRLVNRIAAEITGLSPQRMLGRKVADVYPDLAQILVPALQSVFETGEPVLGQEIQDEDPVTGELRYWLVSRFPLRSEQDDVIGVTSIRTDVTPMKALEEQLEQMLAMESSARVEVEEARFELAQIASTDALTGLANRRLFSEHLALALARAERYGTMLGVLYLDLDGFKAVNDTLGHEEGDKLLCDVADVLREGSRDTDLVARLGGDEFLVLVADLPAHEADGIVRGVAGRLVDRIAGLCPGVSASLGLAFAPLDGSTERELLAVADAEMYDNKRQRKRAA